MAGESCIWTRSSFWYFLFRFSFHTSQLQRPGTKSIFSAFYYYLDFDEQPALSAQTIGLRLDGRIGLTENFILHYAGSYAMQESLNINPLDYSNNYYLADLSAELQNIGRAGAAYEIFNGDQTAAFDTPLATLHAFQGWTDTFLTTPVGGLRDFNIYASSPLTENHTIIVRYHWFQRDDTGENLGTEINASVTYK